MWLLVHFDLLLLNIVEVESNVMLNLSAFLSMSMLNF